MQEKQVYIVKIYHKDLKWSSLAVFSNKDAAEKGLAHMQAKSPAHKYRIGVMPVFETLEDAIENHRIV